MTSMTGLKFFLVILGTIATGQASAEVFFCAMRHPASPPGFPPILVRRTDYSESAKDAACRMLWNNQVIEGTEYCDIPNRAKIVQCLPVPADPVIDPLTNASRLGVSSASGPRRSYRCLMHVIPGNLRMQPHVLVEATNFAEIDAARVALGGRNDVSRAECLPASVYDELFKLIGAPMPAAPVVPKR